MKHYPETIARELNNLAKLAESGMLNSLDIKIRASDNDMNYYLTGQYEKRNIRGGIINGIMFYPDTDFTDPKTNQSEYNSIFNKK